jgi:hypothetical protein
MIKTIRDPKTGPTRIPIRGVRLRCTPPKRGILTWKIANAAAVQNAARVSFRLSVFFTDLIQIIATASTTSAIIHQKAAQNKVKDPSSR